MEGLPGEKRGCGTLPTLAHNPASGTYSSDFLVSTLTLAYKTPTHDDGAHQSGQHVCYYCVNHTLVYRFHLQLQMDVTIRAQGAPATQGNIQRGIRA